MSYQSPLRSLEVVIDDSNAERLCPSDGVTVIDGEIMCRGRMPRDWSKQGFCTMRGSTSLPSSMMIPRSQWTDRVKKMEETESRVSDILLQAGVKSLNQSNTNYCWTNGVVTGIQAMLAMNNALYYLLSSASVAAKIKSYRNQGGWGGDALEYIVENGICSVDLWPANYWQNAKYDTTESRAQRAKNKVTEWYDLRARNFDELFCCLLHRIPVAVGYNWWSHEVCAIDPVVLGNNQYGIRFRNSWGDSYGDQGFNILAERKATPDDACAARVSMISVS